jgi:hypothetical protein
MWVEEPCHCTPKRNCRLGLGLGTVQLRSATLENIFLPRNSIFLFVYYETINRELHRRHIYECRCDERLKTKAEGFTRRSYAGLRGGLREHLKIDTRLRDERFASVVCECVIVTLKVCRLYLRVIIRHLRYST